MSVAAIEFAVVGKTLSTNSAYAGLARRSLANVGTRLCLSGRDFDGDDFDEVGGAETPELPKLVASHVTSSRHTLESLGVNPEKCCGLFRVDQRLNTRGADGRNSCGWFLCEVHCESPLLGGPVRANPSHLASVTVANSVQ
jgi:hypothetical protein